jgi:hypothetical protein
MNNATRAMLNETEKELLRETEADALALLGEDALVDLHTRVRRARTKYAKLYRRRASAQVGQDGGRGRAHAAHARTAAKAEAFEDALARVSQSLARAARATAAEIKAERLAAARSVKGTPAGRGAPGPSRTGTGTTPAAHVKRRTPASKRAAASARATTKRAQARSDAR